jgi:hypothetical protein
MPGLPMWPGLKMLQARPSGPSPRPEMPQRSSIVDIVQLSVIGTKGSTTCQRTPALSVKVGVIRQES